LGAERLQWLAEAAAVRGLALALGLAPDGVRLRIGSFLGRLAFRVDRRHREVAMENLTAAYSDESEEWRRSVAQSAFEHLGRLLVEILEQGRGAAALLPKVRVEGWEHLVQAAEQGKGYFLVSGHFGNWERTAFLQAAMGHPLWMVTRPLDNPRLERFFRGLREGTGNKVVHKRNAVREMVRGLRKGAGIAFVIDQNFGEEGRVFVPFFGRPAATTPSLGRIAARMGVPVVPVFSFPEEGGRYRIVYGPPLPEPLSADPEEAGLEITAAATARLEEAVRACPQAWFWMHRRWRTRPEGEQRGGSRS
jgi:KDO2-lipid IV(A) lauroyltransferase